MVVLQAIPFSICTQNKIQTVLFQAIQFSINTQFGLVCLYHIYPNPPLEQDMTQGQFLNGL